MADLNHPTANLGRGLIDPLQLTGSATENHLDPRSSLRLSAPGNHSLDHSIRFVVLVDPNLTWLFDLVLQSMQPTRLAQIHQFANCLSDSLLPVHERARDLDRAVIGDVHAAIHATCQEDVMQPVLANVASDGGVRGVRWKNALGKRIFGSATNRFGLEWLRFQVVWLVRNTPFALTQFLLAVLVLDRFVVDLVRCLFLARDRGRWNERLVP